MNKLPAFGALAGICTATAIALCVACSTSRTHGKTPVVRLPIVRSAAATTPRGHEAVTVTRDGRLFCRGEARSIREITEIARSAPLTLRADKDAIWMHVQWALVALRESGQRSVWCAVRPAGGTTEGGVRLQTNLGVLNEKFSGPGPGWQVLSTPRICVVTLLSRPAELSPARVMVDSGAPGAATTDLNHVREWAESILVHTTGGGSSDNVYFAVDAPGKIRFGVVLSAVVELRLAGVSSVELGMEALHPWDRELRVLPPPPHSDILARWATTDFPMPMIYPVNLPVASMCERGLGSG